MVVRNDSRLSVLFVVVVQQAVCCNFVWYRRIFSSCLKYTSQDHCLEHSNHKRSFYRVCLQWCSVQHSLSLL